MHALLLLLLPKSIGLEELFLQQDTQATCICITNRNLQNSLEELLKEAAGKHLGTAHRGKELPEMFLEGIVCHIWGQIANEYGVVSCRANQSSCQNDGGGMEH